MIDTKVSRSDCTTEEREETHEIIQQILFYSPAAALLCPHFRPVVSC